MPDNTQTLNISDLSEYKARSGVHMKKQLHEHANALLTKLIRSMLDEADDTLFEFSSNADSNLAQQGYLDAMREVRLKRNDIERGFFAALNKAFSAFDKDKVLPAIMQGNTRLDNDRLELIDDESIEENMAIHNMAEKQQRLFPREIFEIKSRVKALYACKDPDIDTHPLSPVAISNAFGIALESLEIEFHVKLIIFKLFDKFVMSNMGNFYKEINALLIKGKILPNLGYSYKRSQSAYRPDNSRNTYHPGQEQDSLNGHGWDTVENVNAPHPDLQRYPAAHQNGHQSSDPLLSTDFGLHGFTPIPAQSSGVIGTLTAMQNFIRQQGYPEDLRPAEFGNQIISGIHKLGFASVQGKRALDEKVINMVSMIFDFILEDQSITSQIKGLLSRLQIPYLKVALLDETFLDKKAHPARQLLNDMARASIGWDPVRSKGDLFTQIESTVDSVLNDFEQDTQLFSHLHQEFREYCKKEQHINKTYEERTWKTTEGKERVQYAKNRVDAWIHMWCSRQETRKQVATFLKHFWKNTMLYCMHKHGEDSREWRYYIKIINALIWSTTPDKSNDEVKQLINITPLLIRGLNRGMLAVGTHPNTISNIFREFSKCHLDIIEKGLARKNTAHASDDDKQNENDIACSEELSDHDSARITLETLYQPAVETELDKPDLEVDEALETLVETVKIESPAPIDNTAIETIKDEFHEQADKLAYGDWIEFDIDDKTIAAKLAWKSGITSNHLFVGRDGVRVAEKTLDEIAQDLRSGQARRIDQAPVFDRALRAISESDRENIKDDETFS
jgi:hypothetical protein